MTQSSVLRRKETKMAGDKTHTEQCIFVLDKKTKAKMSANGSVRNSVHDRF